MADPPTANPEPDKTTNVGEKPQPFFRDVDWDAYFHEEAAAVPAAGEDEGCSLRKVVRPKPPVGDKDMRSTHVPLDSMKATVARRMATQGIEPVGKVRLCRFPRVRTFDFNPLENLAFAGATVAFASRPPPDEGRPQPLDSSTTTFAEASAAPSSASVDDDRPKNKKDGDALEEMANPLRSSQDDAEVIAVPPSPNLTASTPLLETSAGPLLALPDYLPYGSDPGRSPHNASKFPRRKYAQWVDIAPREQIGGQKLVPTFIHVPESFSGPHAKITLFFGVGQDLNRHGMRTFFEGSRDGVIITVSGTEGFNEQRQVHGSDSSGLRWGGGITRAQIDALITKAMGSLISWEISILAGFSTGYRGLYATVLNTLPAPSLQTWVQPGTQLAPALADLRRVVIFDCLYKDDQSTLGEPNKLTDVLERLTQLATKRSADEPIELLVYDATLAGSTKALRPFADTFGKLKLAAGVAERFSLDVRCLRRTAAPESPPRADWEALITFRLIAEALHDEQINPAEFATRMSDAKSSYSGHSAAISAMLARIRGMARATIEDETRIVASCPRCNGSERVACPPCGATSGAAAAAGSS